MYIEKRNYDLIGILEDEEDALDEFSNYSGYISDAITELADSYIPIYNSDVWEGASKISEFIEDAISEGLAPVQGREIDLVKIFQSGYYKYYSDSLYRNIEVLTFNFVAEQVNDFLHSLDESDIEKIDLNEIESTIENETGNNVDKFDELYDVADDIIKSIKEEIEESDDEEEES